MRTSSVNDDTHLKSHYNTTPPLTVIITIIILVFLLVAFFTLYFCKCFFQKFLESRFGLLRSPNHSAAMDATNDAAPYPGLDATIINTFPTFTYSSVKEYRQAKYGLECAICLLEFEDGHVIRMVKLCCHVFHQDCIDLWFEMHKTCPVCRRNLELLFGEGAPACTTSPDEEGSRRDSVTITIEDDPEEKKGSTGEKGSQEKNDFISRYNTTGHSIFTSIEEEDRFTLELPDHVTQELIKANHWPKHLDTSGESRRNVYIVGEGSDGNIKNVKVPPKFLDNG
ncbi:RING-H2 finger protein ATL29 [Heracleum sosnowskyi]|uniref:RING-type E3 ubiquitin transferase n=1 Tax=Heracleum sosnowskyi TaxID=360622 RepID=A0AAD8M9Q0_9APIA|nr:RING-H2 finger protein ATL29 [Heracleum sosnowskyi]